MLQLARPLLAGLASVMALAAAADAKERASFIEGTFATEKGCKKLEAIAKGKPRNVETAPEVLTADGFAGWEGSCEFTKIFEHEPGQVWVGIMYCVEGAATNAATYAFTKTGPDTFDVAGGGGDEAEEYRRCEAVGAPAANADHAGEADGKKGDEKRGAAPEGDETKGAETKGDEKKAEEKTK